MGMQLRPVHPPTGMRDPFYSPARDLAHVGPKLCALAVESLEDEWREDWFSEYLDFRAVTDEKLADGVKKLASALNNITDPNKSFEEAMQESGFSGLSDAVRIALYIRLGQILLSAIWSAVRDSYAADSEPPAEIAEIAGLAQKLAYKGEEKEKEEGGGSGRDGEDESDAGVPTPFG